MGAKKGTIPPAAGMGRIKGSKNKVSKHILEELDEIDGVLALEGKSLLDCARENPRWYYENFKKLRVPKNLQVEANATIVLNTVDLRRVEPDAGNS